MTITHDALDLTIQLPSPLDMFNLVQLRPYCKRTPPHIPPPTRSPPPRFVHYETHMFGQRVFGIPL